MGKTEGVAVRGLLRFLYCFFCAGQGKAVQAQIRKIPPEIIRKKLRACVGPFPFLIRKLSETSRNPLCKRFHAPKKRISPAFGQAEEAPHGQATPGCVIHRGLAHIKFYSLIHS